MFNAQYFNIFKLLIVDIIYDSASHSESLDSEMGGI